MSDRERTVSTYCYQCVAGPDLLKIRIEDEVATEVAPNFDAARNPPGGRQGVRQGVRAGSKSLQPDRILHPMKRTNPKKGRDQDPGFVAISWDEALDLVAEKLKTARARGLLDESGYPRLAASFGGGGTPTAYMGTLPAFLAAWGPVDMSFGSGQGVKCYHSEHLYGELWHRAFTVSPDTPLCEYLVSFGANVEASGGVCGVKRHADARKRGMKRVQVEPHLSVTGACSAEWMPIKPKTDVGVPLRHDPRGVARAAARTARRAVPEAPHLVTLSGGPQRLFPARSRHAQAAGSSTRPPVAPCRSTRRESSRRSKERLSRSMASRSARTTSRPTHRAVPVRPSFAHLLDHVRTIRPNGRAPICDVDPAVIRRIANEFLDHARVGATDRDRGRDAAVSARRHFARQDGQQRLGRLRMLLGADAACVSCRCARSAGRNARHDGAAQPSRRQSLVERRAADRTGSWSIR